MRCRYPNPFESTAVKNQLKRESRGGWRSFIICRALSRCVLPRRKYLYDTSSWWCEMVWVMVWVQRRSRIWSSAWLRIVRLVLELPWLEWPCLQSQRDRVCTPSVTVFVGTDTKTLPSLAFFSWRFLRRFWGRKRREKRREKVRGAQCYAYLFILHLRSCRMQIIVATLLLYYY